MADINFYQDETDEDTQKAWGLDDSEGGVVDPDSQLSPVERLEKYMQSDNVFNRQMVARGLLDTLRDVGSSEQECAAILQSMIKLSSDPEATVRSELMEQIPHIAMYCQQNRNVFKNAVPNYILPLVVRYLDDGNNQVRKTSQAALLVLLEQDLVEKADIEEQVVELIVELAGPDSPDDYRTEAVALMSKLAPLLGSDVTVNQFLPRFCQLCQDALFQVKKVCAANFGDICSVVGTENAEKVLLPHFVELCSDRVWGVRKACTECFMTVSQICTSNHSKVELTQSFVNLLRDQSRWVRMSAFQALGPVISTFSNSYLTGLTVGSEGEVAYADPDEKSKSPEEKSPEADSLFDEDDNLDDSDEIINVLDEGLTLANSSQNCSRNADTESGDRSANNAGSTICDNEQSLGAGLCVYSEISEIDNSSKSDFRNVNNSNRVENDLREKQIEETLQGKEGNVDDGSSKDVESDTVRLKGDEKELESQEITTAESDKILSTSEDDENILKLDDASHVTVLEDLLNTNKDKIENKAMLVEDKKSEVVESTDEVEYMDISDSFEEDSASDGCVEEKEEKDLATSLHDVKEEHADEVLENSREIHTNVKETFEDVNLRENSDTLQDTTDVTENGEIGELRVGQDRSTGLIVDTSNSVTDDEVFHSLNDVRNAVSSENSTADSSLTTTDESGKVHIHIDNTPSFNTFQFWRSPIPEVGVDMDLVNGMATNIVIKAKVQDAENHKVYQTEMDVQLSRKGEDLENVSAADSVHSDMPSPEVSIVRQTSVDSSGVKVHTASVSTVSEFDTAAHFGTTHVLGQKIRTYSSLGASSCSNLSYIDSDHVTSKDIASINDTELSQLQDIIPASLLENYLSMANPSQVEWVDQDITRHCAYSLPAVAFTLGRHNWKCLKRLYEELAGDIQWKVRRTLAFSIHGLALILGEEITHEDLVPVFEGFLKDLDEVRIGILKHLAKFLKLLRPPIRLRFLTKVKDFLTTDNQRNWRFRLELAEQLVLLCELYDPESIADHMLPIAQVLYTDKVAAVRHTAADLLAIIVHNLTLTPSTTVKLGSFVSDIHAKFAYSTVWGKRQQYVHLCGALLSHSSLKLPHFTSLFLEPLLKLGSDPVANVRIAVARIYFTHWIDGQNIDYYMSDSNPFHSLYVDTLAALENDTDRDVRNFFQKESDIYITDDVPV